ncbi:MAG: hypothetical protein WEA80_03340 [Gemmatimonadaceae bacterium]
MLSRTRSARPRARGRWREVGRHTSAILAALAIAASTLALACGGDALAPIANDEISAAKNPPGLGPLDARNVGAYHNAFLDYAYPRLLDAVRHGADQRRICKVIAQAMRDFVVARNIPADPASIRDDVAGGRCAGLRHRKPGARFSLAGDGTPIPELDALISEMAYAVESGVSQAEIATLFEQKVAYARANFPEAEAEVVVAAASVGLSSVEYWEANYSTQEQGLLDAMSAETYNRIELDAPRIPDSGSSFSRDLIAPPGTRLDGSFWSKARKVGVSDLAGAVKGGIKGWSGGWQGIAAGAAIEGGAASAGTLISIVLQ